MRILGLLTDAFGGYGGIAAANRQFLRALCAADAVDEVVALPRLMPEPPGPWPDALSYRRDGLGGLGSYGAALARLLLRDRSFDLIWCGHIHLVPLALAARALTGAPVLLHIHGIDAWTPTDRGLVNRLVPFVDAFVGVSAVTNRRFTAWSGVPSARGFVVPNTIGFEALTPGPRDAALVDRYGLTGRFVCMTMGRLVGPERKKGFDRMLEVLPRVAETRPAVAYLIVGKGPDQPRLAAKAERLGVRDRVVFAGFVPEEEKAAHFRLADVYAMPSEGEGFGLVLLEAMACGAPVIASTRDGSQEALAQGRFGRLIDPRDDAALCAALRHPPPAPDRAAVVDTFGPAAYRQHVAALLDAVVPTASR
ncbi:glycosyltransferase family 4 protein [Salisaeta longa]|uniref:glycosyltransferase family 4 protein n=1 Tax=Salisaeta longa TaxID=503170 RepID=UPI0003B779C2|nr:glycosyltransferase family 4 protein [Salisaeta longa]